MGTFEKIVNLVKDSYQKVLHSGWTRVKLKKHMCICLETFKRHGEPTFYETIYYSYSQYNYKFFIFDTNDRVLELSGDEFNKHFQDYRDWVLGRILS